MKLAKLLFLVLIVGSASLYTSVMRRNRIQTLREEKTVKLKKETATEFELKNWDAQSVRLSELNKTNYILLNFWAAWCEPCIQELPDMMRFQKLFEDKPIRIVAVNVGENWGQIKTFFKDKLQGRPPFEVLSDLNQRVVSEWGTTKFPETYLIAPGGRVIDKFIGAIPWMDTKTVEHFQEILN